MTTDVQQYRVGVIGLGAMGLPMAQHLLTATGSLQITGRRPERASSLVEAGATWHDTPRSLAAACDSILVMLPDLPELDSVLGGTDGILAGADELLLMIGSTVSPTGLRELADRLETDTQNRVRVVDCPVSGGEDGAQAATLSIMLGGADDDVTIASNILSACGRPVPLGPLGAGEVAKACNQMIVASTILALGEASVLAERSGIDLAVLWDLLGGGYAGSNLLESRRDKLVTGDDSPSGVAKYMVKDLRFAADVADATSTDPVLLPTLRAAFDELVSAGLGDRDISTTRRFIAMRDADRS